MGECAHAKRRMRPLRPRICKAIHVAAAPRAGLFDAAEAVAALPRIAKLQRHCQEPISSTVNKRVPGWPRLVDRERRPRVKKKWAQAVCLSPQEIRHLS